MSSNFHARAHGGAAAAIAAMPALLHLQRPWAPRLTDELLRGAFDQAVVGMAVCWPEAAGVTVNRAFCEFIGYTRQELAQIDPCSLAAPDERATDAAVRRQLLDGAIASHRRDKRFVHKDGRLLWADFSCTLVRDRRGQPGYFLGQVVDITQARHAQLQLDALNQRLEERVRERTRALELANRELEAFAYSIAHDLRAPMMAVGGFSRMLQQRLGPDDADGQHCLDRIVGNVQRMGELTDALLSLARLSGAAIEREPLDLGALARELAAELDEAGGAHRPTLCVKGDLRAWGNARLLRQVLANLLANAWKFTARQPRPAVEVGALPAAPGEPRVFYVRDNGAGFDMRRAADLFRPFHRLHPEHEFAGTGIGLAVVRKIVERHGGSVWAEAAPGLGATFYVSLPDADGADTADAG